MTVPTAPAPVRADRAVGAVLGSAAGDALGAGYEFGPPHHDSQTVGMKGGGAFAWEPGEWTDDTQMALAILTPLAEGAVEIGRIEAGFRAWFDSGPADVGNQTAAVLRGQGPLRAAAARFTSDRPDRAAGNGSLMRTGPVALAHPDDPAAIATLTRHVSELTHPDPDCVDACVLWSVTIDHTIHHAPASDQPWDWAQALRHALPHLPQDRRARWTQLIDEAARSRPVDFSRNSWVVHAFQAALAAICSTPVPTDQEPATHLRLTLENAVRGGGDTDTVGAIAGSMLGARWGATAVPFAWRRVLHGRRIYGEPPLLASDLERMARLAFSGGHSDSHGWPSVRSMLPHYERQWPAESLRVDFDGVGFGNVHALSGAIAAGADMVISLCRMGADEVPSHVEHHTLGFLDTTAEENPNLEFILRDTADGLRQLIAEGRRVFVHCVQAENRTPTLAAAWLIHTGSTPGKALDQVSAALNRPKPFLATAVHHLPAPPRPREQDR